MAKRTAGLSRFARLTFFESKKWYKKLIHRRNRRAANQATPEQLETLKDKRLDDRSLD